jgi:hypothetical protein
MKVLNPTQAQYDKWNGYKANTSEILFVKDGADKWVVGLEVLDDPNFADIRSKLNIIARIDYTPLPDNE